MVRLVQAQRKVTVTQQLFTKSCAKVQSQNGKNKQTKRKTL